MDTGEGKMEFFENENERIELEKLFPNHGQVFTEGEVVGVFKEVEQGEIDGMKYSDAIGSHFVIKEITSDGLILKLLPKEANQR